MTSDRPGRAFRFRVVVFDLGGVLIRLKPFRVFLRFLSSHSGFQKRDYPLFIPLVNRMLDGTLTVRAFHRLFARKYGLSVRYPDFLEAFSGRWLGGEMTAVTRYVRRLRGKVRLWMLSNTNAEHVRFIRRTTRIFPLFDRVFFSHILGMNKPEAGLFRLVNRQLRKIGVRPDEVLFVDDASENRRAGRNAGWKALVRTTNRQDVRGISEALERERRGVKRDH